MRRFPSWFLVTPFLFLVLSQSSAHLDLYLNLLEVKRLLGVSAELYYVRNGHVNDYALNFVVPVPGNMSTLHFTWQSLSGTPVPYLISMDVSDLVALKPPRLNISQEGSVPSQVQTFAVELICTGRVDAEVDVSIIVAVSLRPTQHHANFTRLNFKRRKICLRDPNGGVSEEKSLIEEEGAVSYIAISCACFLATLVVIALLACYMRTSKSRLHSSRGSRLGSSSSGGPFLGPVVSCGVSAASTGSVATPRHRIPPNPGSDLHHRIAQLTVQRCRVRLKSIVLEGTFGRVYKGTYTEEDGFEEQVLVKTVTDQASAIQVSLLLQEGMMMYGLSHKNILTILGVSIEDHTAPFLIYHHQGYTNLKRFLQKCKLSPEGVAHTLTTQEVVDMAIQIISGIQYLHKKKILHKDLATRNCVVDDKLRVQLTDNALSRDLFPADYHCLGDNENRPVKWLALESLSHKTFSSASDVWSFGVIVWELTTLAQQPYVEIDPFEIAAYLKDGYRLAQPINCPDELFAVMAYCWAMSPDERPTLSQLTVCLQEFYTQLTRYV